MHGRQHERGERRRDELAPMRRHLELTAEQRLRRRSPQADDHARLDHLDLGGQPRPAGGDLTGVGLFVDSPLSPRDPLEVLHHVGDVRIAAIDLGLGERAIEQLAGGAHERVPGEGVRIRLGEKVDVTVKNPAFAQALWEVYLGPNAVNEGLKASLVGRLKP